MISTNSHTIQRNATMEQHAVNMAERDTKHTKILPSWATTLAQISRLAFALTFFVLVIACYIVFVTLYRGITGSTKVFLFFCSTSILNFTENWK